MAARSTVTGTRNGLEIIEEAVHLLRLAPLRIPGLYLIAALPFALAATWFVSDMSRSAFASEQLIGSSFWVALAFEWKQIWQAVFAAEVHGLLDGQRIPWTSNRFWRMVVLQCAIQPLSLVLLPASLIGVFPFPYTIAFFRNLTLYAGLGRDKPLRLARASAGMWTAQAWIAISVFTLLALLLFLNYLLTLAIVPELLKSFLGIENAMTRYSRWVLNSTAMTATAALVYLTLDALLDAVYVLRCFYSESISTGSDLRAGLRRALSMAVLVIGFAGLLAHAEPPAAPVASQRPTTSRAPLIAPERLKQSIEEVVHRREFTWNSPRTETEQNDSKLVGWVKSAWKSFKRTVNRFVDWIEGIFFPEQPGETSGTGQGGGSTVVRWLLIALGAGFVLAIAYMFYRQRQARTLRIRATPVAAKPVIDLRDESVTADQLPEDSWYSLARECADEGNYRLALRATYLGAISHLGRRELVVIQRWKSGLDYSRELSRPTRSTPEVAPAFSKAVRVFEGGWYGRHTVDRQTLDEFTADFEEVKRGAK